MNARKLLYVVLVLLPLTVGSLSLDLQTMSAIPDGNGSTLVDVGNGQFIEVGPDEVLNKYVISDIPTEMKSTGAPLNGSEYGIRTDIYTDQTMQYDSGTQTTNTLNLSIPFGPEWEGYQVFANLTDITENRTWVANHDIESTANWSFLVHDEPSEFGPYTNTITSEWLADGPEAHLGCSHFAMEGYYHYANESHYGDWYDEGDKAYILQNITVDRGEITWFGISMDYRVHTYWNDWGGYPPTGFFEVFASVGDPDNGGDYLWQRDYDLINVDGSWYSTGLVEAETQFLESTNFSLMAGLRVTDTEWYRSQSGPLDIEPEAWIDNVIVYTKSKVRPDSTKSKVRPDSLELKMNGEDVQNVMVGAQYAFGLGTILYDRSDNPWTNGFAYANFSWTPDPNPPVPDFGIDLKFDASIAVYARRYNVMTRNDTVTYNEGSNLQVQNATDVRWDTAYAASVPGGYSPAYFFNVTTPLTWDIDYVASPEDRWINLTAGWSYGDPGDGLLNVSAYEVTQENLDGFWIIKGSSPNIISDLEIWDNTAADWTRTVTFRADETTRFMATLPTTYAGITVEFSIYDPSSTLRAVLPAVVAGDGSAITNNIYLEASNSSVGVWEVQAFVVDAPIQSSVRNAGYFTRHFSIQHSTSMSVHYPIGAETMQHSRYPKSGVL
jgi:hypothetical protein